MAWQYQNKAQTTSNALATITVNLPTGIQAGDLLVMLVGGQVGYGSNGIYPTGDPSWILGGSRLSRDFVFYKFATGSEGSTVVITPSYPGTYVIQVLRFTGVSRNVVPTQFQNGSSTTSLSMPAITNSTKNSLLVMQWVAYSTATAWTLTGSTEVSNLNVNSSSGQVAVSYANVATVGTIPTNTYNGVSSTAGSGQQVVGLLFTPQPDGESALTHTANLVAAVSPEQASAEVSAETALSASGTVGYVPRADAVASLRAQTTGSFTGVLPKRLKRWSTHGRSSVTYPGLISSNSALYSVVVDAPINSSGRFRVMRSTNNGLTWTEQDSAVSTGSLYTQYGHTVVEKAGTIYVLYHSSLTGVQVRRFSTSTNTWGTATTASTSKSSGPQTMKASARSNGNVVLSYTLSSAECDLYYTVLTTSWSTPAVFLDVTGTNPSQVLAQATNSSDLTYFIYYNGIAANIGVRTLSSAGVLGTAAVLDSSAPAVYTNQVVLTAEPWVDAGVTKLQLAYTRSDNTLWTTTVSLDADPPTFTTPVQLSSSTTLYAGSEVATGRYGTTTYVFATDSSDNLKVFSKEDSSGTWSSASTWRSSSQINSVLPVTDNGLLVAYSRSNEAFVEYYTPNPVTGAAMLDAENTFAATGTIPPTIKGTASLSADGTLDATGTFYVVSEAIYDEGLYGLNVYALLKLFADLNADGLLTSTGTYQKAAGKSDLAAETSLDAPAQKTNSALCDLSADTGLTATGVFSTVYGESDLSASADLTSPAALTYDASAVYNTTSTDATANASLTYGGVSTPTALADATFEAVADVPANSLIASDESGFDAAGSVQRGGQSSNDASGSLTASADADVPAEASLSALGSTTLDAVLTRAGVTALSGQGDSVNEPVVLLSGTLTASGETTTTALATMTWAGSANFATDQSLDVDAETDVPAASDLVAEGTVSGSAAVEHNAQAVLTGLGDSDIDAVADVTAALSLDASGTLSATANVARPAFSTIDAESDTTALPSVTWAGAAPLDATSINSPTAALTYNATYTGNGDGSVSATGICELSATSTVTGNGDLVADSICIRSTTTLSNAEGSFLADSVADVPANALIASDESDLTADGVVTRAGTVTLSASSDSTASAIADVPAQADTSSLGSLTADAQMNLAARADPQADADISSDGVMTWSGQSSASAFAILSADSLADVEAELGLTGSASLVGVGSRLIETTSALSAESDATFDSRITIPAFADLSASGVLDADTLADTPAFADLTAETAFDAASVVEWAGYGTANALSDATPFSTVTFAATLNGEALSTCSAESSVEYAAHFVSSADSTLTVTAVCLRDAMSNAYGLAELVAAATADVPANSLIASDESTLTAAATITRQGTGSASGGSSLSATAIASVPAFSDLADDSAVTAGARCRFGAQAPISGEGNLTVESRVRWAGSTTLSTNQLITAMPVLTLQGNVALTALGSGNARAQLDIGSALASLDALTALTALGGYLVSDDAELISESEFLSDSVSLVPAFAGGSSLGSLLAEPDVIGAPPLLVVPAKLVRLNIEPLISQINMNPLLVAMDADERPEHAPVMVQLPNRPVLKLVSAIPTLVALKE